ncbi:glycosyltransferase involved in cell wall biosynthesis [Salinibacter ruber]|uniref:glycosyltransferase n=1 Tax=Salinibacter ruber TaxID=146919 RepID=UPI002169673D|nr:glycosyltransferase [Salinibacter ruber]MCS3937292.1 glycosyltransferase involved in cell wall biosynthesis [Salinibacter ruber]
MRVAVLFARLGPYHVARLRALSEHHAVTAVELSGENINYTWDPVDASGLHHVQLFDMNHRTARPRRLRRTLRQALDRDAPDVIAVPGWWDPGALLGIEWAHDRGVPVVLMSDSTRHDAPRVWWHEWPKKRVVGLCQSGFVAGRRHEAYLSELRLSPARIVQGYDVVDNAHFSEGADRSRNGQAVPSEEHGFPAHYFLSCARFVEKKNLPMLVRAYARYRDQISTTGWPLVIVGDGPQRDAIDAEVQRLDLREHVYFPGFKQYDELPAYYGRADAFILPSKYEQWGLVVNEAMAAGLPVLVSERCGCAPDLVAEGENGWTFAPDAPGELAQLMTRISEENIDCTALGQASRERIQAWSPETFAASMTEAVRIARQQNVSSLSPVDRVLLRALAYKATLTG